MVSIVHSDMMWSTAGAAVQVRYWAQWAEAEADQTKQAAREAARTAAAASKPSTTQSAGPQAGTSSTGA